jgi:hypothetical protein
MLLNKQEILQPHLLPQVTDRIESGPLQFGEDWPGLYLRGDSALGYAQSLSAALDKNRLNSVDRIVLQGLLEELQSCQSLRNGTREVLGLPEQLTRAELLKERAELQVHLRYIAIDGRQFPDNESPFLWVFNHEKDIRWQETQRLKSAVRATNTVSEFMQLAADYPEAAKETLQQLWLDDPTGMRDMIDHLEAVGVFHGVNNGTDSADRRLEAATSSTDESL